MAVALLLAVALGVASVASGWLGRPLKQLEMRGGLSAFLLLLTLAFWGFALALRLVSFATSWLRAIVGLALGLAALRGLMELGVFPGGNWLDGHFPWLSVGLLGIVAGGAVVIELALEGVNWVVHKTAGRNVPYWIMSLVYKAPPRSLTMGADSLGLGMALLATLVIGGAAVAVLRETTALGGAPPKLERPLVAPFVKFTSATDSAGRALAARYYPVLTLTAEERWAPEAVDDWLSDAKMLGPKLDDPWEPGEPLPTSCEDLAPTPCFKLTHHCSSDAGLDKCAPSHPRHLGELQRDGAAYVRVLPWRPLPRDGSGDVFVNRGPYRDRLRILLQYWFFYPHDRWASQLLAGSFVQEHESDWEAVTIGLEDPSKPLFVAYSAHCGGHWKDWSEVEKADDDEEHPLVAVATGSQANYPKADRHQPPNWTTCKSLPGGATTLLTYALNARDTTAYDWTWYPSELIPVDGDTQPMNFPGRWGEKEQITITNFKEHVFDPGVAPMTPTLQPLWQQPVKQIFCGPFEPRSCDKPPDAGD
jgi:hypothetical protein